MVAGAGCNVITGADSLVLRRQSDGGGGAGGAGGATVGGAGGAVATTGVGGGGQGSGGLGASAYGYADGVALTSVDLYQGIRRPLVAGGALVTSDIPIVAGKDAMVRLFYATSSGYDGQPVTARFSVNNGPAIEQTVAITGTSSQPQLGSTINLALPGATLTPGATFKVELLQPSESSSGSNGEAAFPSDGGTAPLAVQQGGVKLKITLVPVSNNGTLPDTSSAQVQAYQTLFAEQYPVAAVAISVRSQAYTFNGDLSSYNGWTALLDEITTLRGQDGVPADVYYYGIHAGPDTGLLGLGWVASPNDVTSRAAIGVGWTGNTAPETAIHEVGHNHGRQHSPCGVAGDANFPHPGAGIGVWGFSPSQNALFSPSTHKDFMSYCQPRWVSDWTFQALFTRLKQVSTSPLVFVPDHLKNRTYDRVRVLHGQLSWRPPVTLAIPPMGEVTDVEIVTAAGGKQTVHGHYYPYDHLNGGLLYLLRPQQWQGSLDSIQSLKVEAEGQHLQLGGQ